MKPIFEHWQEIASRIRERKSIFLALDYDGVLAPIAAQPDLAVLSPANRHILEQLIKCPGAHLAVISGRALSDIRQHVGISSIVYAGNHGSEIDLNGVARPRVETQEFREQLVEMKRQLAVAFCGFRGAILEDKGFGIGLHYREVEPAQIPAFHEQFGQWSKQLPAELQVLHAKKVYELRPRVAWNKGNAVLYVWQSIAPDALPICLGDDLTDEDGFRALQGKGINIFVGEERQSYAEYILASTSEVTTFLGRLLTEIC